LRSSLSNICFRISFTSRISWRYSSLVTYLVWRSLSRTFRSCSRLRIESHTTFSSHPTTAPKAATSTLMKFWSISAHPLASHVTAVFLFHSSKIKFTGRPLISAASAKLRPPQRIATARCSFCCITITPFESTELVAVWYGILPPHNSDGWRYRISDCHSFIRP